MVIGAGSGIHPVEWDELIEHYQTTQGFYLTIDDIQTILTQMQIYINSSLPENDSIDQKLRIATDAVYNASLVLAVAQSETPNKERLRSVTDQIYLAIKTLIE